MIIKTIIKFINFTESHQTLPYLLSQINVSKHILPYQTNLKK